MKAKLANLEILYTTLKNLSSELKVTGWASPYCEGVCFNESTTLLEWLLKNISELKRGVKNLIVANAYSKLNEYSVDNDEILISTEITSFGLLVVIKVIWYTDNGFHDFSGRYAIEYHEKEIILLLKYKKIGD